MPYRPAKLLQIVLTNLTDYAWYTYDDGTGDPWIGYPYQWSADITVNIQSHSSHITPTPFYFTGNDIQVGDYITTMGQGRILKVVEITSQSEQNASLILEDVDRVNSFSDSDQNGSGALATTDGYLFEVHDGYPILFPVPDGLVGSLPSYFAEQIMSRFFYRKQSYEVYVDQAAHGFVVGDVIYLTSGASGMTGYSGMYHLAKADESGTANVIGIVTEIGVPGPDKFRYRPVGPLVQMPMPSGIPGSNVYLSDSVAGGMVIPAPSGTSITERLFIKIDDVQGIWVGLRGGVGISGFSGYSGSSGASGSSGVSGYSGQSGIGISGFSGFTGFSGARGPAGTGVVEKPVELVYSHSGFGVPENVKNSRMDGLNFPTAANTACDFGFEIPDDYELNTDVQIVGAFYCDTVEASSFRVVLDYEVIDLGGDGTPAGPTGTITQIVSNPSIINPDTTGQFVLTVPKADISNITEKLRFTIQRSGTHGSDTYSGNVILENIAMRYTGFGAPTDKSGVSGFSGFSGMIVGGIFAKTVQAHTADDVLTIGESGSTHTNTNETALVTLTLPSASIGTIGTWYVFMCDDADGLKIQADSGDYIRIGSSLSISGGYVQTNTIGATVALTCIKQNHWYAEYGVDLGNWTVV